MTQHKNKALYKLEVAKILLLRIMLKMVSKWVQNNLTSNKCINSFWMATIRLLIAMVKPNIICITKIINNLIPLLLQTRLANRICWPQLEVLPWLLHLISFRICRIAFNQISLLLKMPKQWVEIRCQWNHIWDHWLLTKDQRIIWYLEAFLMRIQWLLVNKTREMEEEDNHLRLENRAKIKMRMLSTRIIPRFNLD